MATMTKKKVLIVIDVQNDFITGALKNEEAIKALPNIVKLLKSEKYDEVYVTMDTHGKDYLKTLEGQKLPVEHCIEGTWGWHMPEEVTATKAIQNAGIYEKPTFGSRELANHLWAHIINENFSRLQDYEFTIIGFCTDICVVSNALMLRANFPNNTIRLIENCTAGVTPESKAAAIQVLTMNQVEIV